MKRWFSAAVMAAVLVSAMAAWGAPVRLEFKGEPGQELRYETQFEGAMEFTMPAPGGQGKLTVRPEVSGRATTINQVVSVAENGDLTMGGRIESFDVKLDVADLHARLAIEGPDGGPPQLIKLPALPIHTVVDKLGKPLAIEGLQGMIPPIPGPNGQKLDVAALIDKVMSKFAQPVLPDKPVSVGDTWGWEMVVDPLEMMEMMGIPMPEEAKEPLKSLRIPIRNTSKLVALEMMEGVECAKIEADAPWELNMPMGPPGQGAPELKEWGSTKVTTWFDHAAGRTVKEDVDVQVQMRAGEAGQELVTMEMRLNASSKLK